MSSEGQSGEPPRPGEPAVPGDPALPQVPAASEVTIAGLGALARVLVSDADRARVADVIGGAYAEGRLTPVEYDERLSATMSARTVADLVPVVDGLPADQSAKALAPLIGSALPTTTGAGVGLPRDWSAPDGAATSSSSVVAIFGGSSRKGQWVVPTQLTAFAMFGGVELDLTAATFAGGRAEITAVAVMGGVEITVPDGITVQVDGVGILGGFDNSAEGPGQPGAPTLVVKGAALFGGVEVKRKRKRGSLGRRPDRPELT